MRKYFNHRVCFSAWFRFSVYQRIRVFDFEIFDLQFRLSGFRAISRFETTFFGGRGSIFGKRDKR